MGEREGWREEMRNILVLVLRQTGTSIPPCTCVRTYGACMDGWMTGFTRIYLLVSNSAELLSTRTIPVRIGSAFGQLGKSYMLRIQNS